MHSWTKMWRVLSDQSSESDKETERKRSWNGGSRKGGGTVSCYQPSENNQDRRGNLKNRQGNYKLKCLSSESLFQITTSSFHVSDQEVISSKPLVQKVILDPTLMAGQRKYLFPSNGIQSIRWRSNRSLLIFGIYFHHPLKHPQPMSSTKCIRRGDSWSLGICWCSSIHIKVNCAMMSPQPSIGSSPTTCARLGWELPFVSWYT